MLRGKNEKNNIINNYSYIILIGLILYKSIFNITDLSDFQPFINNTDNVIIVKESALKINTNLPTINASVSFYPLAASIVRSIYDKNLKLIEEWLLSEQGQNLVKDMGFQSIN